MYAYFIVIIVHVFYACNLASFIVTENNNNSVDFNNAASIASAIFSNWDANQMNAFFIYNKTS